MKWRETIRNNKNELAGKIIEIVGMKFKKSRIVERISWIEFNNNNFN